MFDFVIQLNLIDSDYDTNSGLMKETERQENVKVITPDLKQIVGDLTGKRNSVAPLVQSNETEINDTPQPPTVMPSSTLGPEMVTHVTHPTIPDTESQIPESAKR